MHLRSSALAILALFATSAAFATSTVPDPAAHLAGAHAAKGVTCESCHKSGVSVSDGEREVNASCVGCHGPMEKIPVSTQGPNPHKSHLGDIQCTTCHRAHESSRAYCLECHDFPQFEKMPFAGPKRPAPKPLDNFTHAKPERVETVDLVVVGSGAAGFVAAMEAHDRGVRNIVILEKMPIPGGNSQLAAGGMNAAGTSFQKAQGIEDQPELMAADTMKGGKNVSDPALVDVLARESAASVEWLRERGAPLENVARGAGASAARMHGPKPEFRK